MKRLEKLRVIDLPMPLINLIGKQLGFDVGDVQRNAKEALSKINWIRATEEELLSYASLMYPAGTVFRDITLRSLKYRSTCDPYFFGNRGIAVRPPLEGGAVFFDEKWAEIIKESDDILFSDGCTDEDKEKIREMIKQVEPKRQREEPTFKEGDMVDYIPCSLRNERSWRSRVRFTGGMTSDGEYVIEFQNKTVGLASEIRKHKPSIDEDEDQSLPDHVVKFRIEEIESKMDYLMESIEALKKGKRL